MSVPSTGLADTETHEQPFAPGILAVGTPVGTQGALEDNLSGRGRHNSQIGR